MTSGNEASAKARHVFVVEDDPLVGRVIVKVLASADFSVNEFDRIEQVEEALTRRRPELVVLDLSLGGTDAMEVMRSLASARYSGKIVLLSGHDASTLADVEAYGARHGLAMLPYLRKPFRVAEFMERIAGLSEPLASAGDATLLAGLRNNWLEVCYQPKIRLDTLELRERQHLAAH